jgi:hypothetical protein
LKSYVLHIWEKNGLMSHAVSTTSKPFAEKVKKWAESEGYRVEWDSEKDNGGSRNK